MALSEAFISKKVFLQALAASGRAYMDAEHETGFVKSELSKWDTVGNLKFTGDYAGKESKYIFKNDQGYFYKDMKSGAQAVLMKEKNKNSYILAFTGTDEFKDVKHYTQFAITKSYIDNYKPFLDAIVNIKSLEDAQITVTGHSLGAAAANILATTKNNSWNKAFSYAEYVTFESPYMVKHANMLNFGHQNDLVYNAPLIRNGKGWKDNAITHFYVVEEQVRAVPPLTHQNLKFHGLDIVSPILESMIGKDAIKETVIDLFYYLSQQSYVYIDHRVGSIDLGSQLHGEHGPFHPFPALPDEQLLTVIGENRKDVILGSNDTEQRELIFGMGGDDILSGGLGSDILCGGSGKDKLDGGEGYDTVLINAVSKGKPIEVYASVDRQSLVINGDEIKDCEHIEFGDVTSIVVINASSKDHMFEFGELADIVAIDVETRVLGRGGNDVLIFNANSIEADGGDGADIFKVGNILPVMGWDGGQGIEGNSPATISLDGFDKGSDKFDLSALDGDLFSKGMQKCFISEVLTPEMVKIGSPIWRGEVNDTRPGSVTIYKTSDFTDVMINRDSDSYSEMVINIGGDIGNIRADFIL